MEVTSFINWIKQNNVEDNTINNFWECFENYKLEYPNEYENVFKSFNKDCLTLKIQQISLSLGNYPEFNYNHVVSYLPIVYKEETIGLYRLFFTLSGEIDDDSFTIY